MDSPAIGNRDQPFGTAERRFTHFGIDTPWQSNKNKDPSIENDSLRMLWLCFNSLWLWLSLRMLWLCFMICWLTFPLIKHVIKDYWSVLVMIVHHGWSKPQAVHIPTTWPVYCRSGGMASLPILLGNGGLTMLDPGPMFAANHHEPIRPSPSSPHFAWPWFCRCDVQRGTAEHGTEPKVNHSNGN